MRLLVLLLAARLCGVERALALIGAIKRQLAKPPAQRIGDTTVPKLKQETEQACKL